MDSNVKMAAKRSVWYEPGRCWGCGNCVARCAELESHRGKPACSIVMVGALPTPMRCMHCTDARCMAICPVKAIKQQGEAVVIEANRCMGCGLCAMACPFGVVSFDERTRKPLKCDLCIDNVENGEIPVCVMACPNKSLQFIDINDLMAKYQEKAACIPKYLATGSLEALINALYTISPTDVSKYDL